MQEGRKRIHHAGSKPARFLPSCLPHLENLGDDPLTAGVDGSGTNVKVKVLPFQGFGYD
jgi:hypothetical protein